MSTYNEVYKTNRDLGAVSVLTHIATQMTINNQLFFFRVDEVKFFELGKSFKSIIKCEFKFICNNIYFDTQYQEQINTEIQGYNEVEYFCEPYPACLREMPTENYNSTSFALNLSVVEH